MSKALNLCWHIQAQYTVWFMIKKKTKCEVEIMGGGRPILCSVVFREIRDRTGHRRELGFWVAQGYRDCLGGNRTPRHSCHGPAPSTSFSITQKAPCQSSPLGLFSRCWPFIQFSLFGNGELGCKVVREKGASIGEGAKEKTQACFLCYFKTIKQKYHSRRMCAEEKNKL